MRIRRISTALVAGVVLALGNTLVASPASAHVLPVQAANLGDSFASGEGGIETGPYLAGSDTATDRCHRSATSAAQLLGKTRLIKITDDVACSGDVTQDIYATSHFTEPPQVTRLHGDIRLAYVMIGGNNVGFGTLVGCFIQADCEQTPYPALSLQAIAQLGPQLDTAYSAIRAAAPRATVVVTLYPPILPPPGDEIGPFCPYMNPSEQVLADQIETALNSTIAARAQAHGFEVADPARKFRGHDACAAGSYFYVPGTVPGAATLHPNLPGRFALAKANAAASI